MTCDHYDRAVGALKIIGVLVFDSRQQFESIHLRHLNVGVDEVVGLVLRHVETLLAVFGYIHVVSFVGEYFAECVADTAFVIYD